MLAAGELIIAEGAQGTLLDIDHGIYPFVTSSNTIASTVYSGLGIRPNLDDKVIGVMKAYTTQVGRGPFPTRMSNYIEEEIVRRGKEFGTTTGRMRKCGWLDLPALKYAIRLNGCKEVCITKLDILDTQEQVMVCTGYQLDGRDVPFTNDYRVLEKVQPVYKTFEGWRQSTEGITEYKWLPFFAKVYLEFLEKELNVSFSYIGTGPERGSLISR